MTALTLPSIPSLGSSNYWCLTISNPDYIFIEACSAERLDRWKRLEKQAIRNTLIYVLNFTKWLPIVPFGIYIIMRYDNMWMNVVFIIAFNSGGFFNCILYLMNQAFLRDSKSKSFVSLGNYNNIHKKDDNDNNGNFPEQKSKEEQEKLCSQNHANKSSLLSSKSCDDDEITVADITTTER
nr:12659_t:CDS:2 [Entrophospora candida]